jgi:hypothetical protein
MLVLMLDPRFKSLRLVFFFIGHDQGITNYWAIWYNFVIISYAHEILLSFASMNKIL